MDPAEPSISMITPLTMLNEAVKFTTTWDPSHYNKIDSIKYISYNWYIPVYDFYNSQLSGEKTTTIGFGITLFQFFLDRPFIDLNHPRNWLIYLPLLQPISSDELLVYLKIINANYFLIPTERYFSRNIYEAALKNSTLFKIIASSAIVEGSNGQKFKFEKLASFDPFDLYGLIIYK